VIVPIDRGSRGLFGPIKQVGAPPPSSLGFDSLMGLQLKQWEEGSL
jgi:hypothetical protein